MDVVDRPRHSHQYIERKVSIFIRASSRNRIESILVNFVFFLHTNCTNAQTNTDAIVLYRCELEKVLFINRTGGDGGGTICTHSSVQCAQAMADRQRNAWFSKQYETAR